MCRKILVAAAVLALGPLAACGDDNGGDDGGGIEVPDGGTDGGEGGTDGGRDGGPDARRDGGSVCNIGNACDPTSGAGCRGTNECQAPLPFPAQPVVDQEGNPTGDSVEGGLFADGYCMPSIVVDPAAGRLFETCDPNDPRDTTCGDCGTCVTLTDGANACLRSCNFNLDDNDVCRDGYACTTGDFCLDGCTSDVECQVYRDDVDGDGEDELVLDPALMGATCDPDTFRCDKPGSDTARAGDDCTRDSECEPNGFCIDSWPGGGYCTKLRCNVEGNGCAHGAKCQERGLGIDICVKACTVGTDASGNPVPADDPSTWTTANGGCEAGYTCFWDGEGTGEGNGACVPGTFTDVTTPNVGGRCASDEDCWSPFGLGRCLEETSSGALKGGVCSISDCNAAGLPADVCGPDAACITQIWDRSDPSFGLCMPTCTTGADCRAGYGCVDLDGDMGPLPAFCLFGESGGACIEDEDCPLPGQTCMGATATSVGECVGGPEGACRNDGDCSVGSVCEGASGDTLGTCQANKCRNDGDCLTGLCDGYVAASGSDPETLGTCREDACREDTDCDTGLCEGATADALGTCRADACRTDDDCTDALCVGATMDTLGTCTAGACRSDMDCDTMAGETCSIPMGDTVGTCVMAMDGGTMDGGTMDGGMGG